MHEDRAVLHVSNRNRRIRRLWLWQVTLDEMNAVGESETFSKEIYLR